MRRALIIMAKSPMPGHVKTRLVPPLDEYQAAQLYSSFLDDTIALVRAVSCTMVNLQPVLAYSPPEAYDHFAPLVPEFNVVAQRGPDLNHRLANVLAKYLNAYDQVAAISSDSPTVPAWAIAQAYERLSDPAVDAVFGPCEDGGYYLIALDRPRPKLIHDVRMSTTHVLRDSLAIASRENIKVALLPPWYDIDTVAELNRLRGDLTRLPATTAMATRRFLSETSELYSALDCRDDA